MLDTYGCILAGVGAANSQTASQITSLLTVSGSSLSLHGFRVKSLHGVLHTHSRTPLCSPLVLTDIST